MPCCLLHPKCEYHRCGEPATMSCMVPYSWKPPLRLAPKFYCAKCWETFTTAWRAPMKGIDRPEWADDDWRPSIDEHWRHGAIAVAFVERQEREAAARQAHRKRS